jgi:hypothetical protein
MLKMLIRLYAMISPLDAPSAGDHRVADELAVHTRTTQLLQVWEYGSGSDEIRV